MLPYFGISPPCESPGSFLVIQHEWRDPEGVTRSLGSLFCLGNWTWADVLTELENTKSSVYASISASPARAALGSEQTDSIRSSQP